MTDYKATLNLPQTKFPMKADLPKREPEFLQFWEKIGLYRLILDKGQKCQKKYILHDGPPYANGDIHIGHALNKILKDFIVKYKAMQGHYCAYVPGWDCHGLPVEHQLFKELKITKYQIGQLEFRKKAFDYALRYVGIQKAQFQRLGVLGDWENPYLTLSADYETGIVNSLAILLRKGYIYRGLKPVNWCAKCETALAEAEVEYQDHTSPSIYVKFKLEGHPDFAPDSHLVIWTTTPWTLLANVAVAVHPEFIYAYIKSEKANLIIAKDLLPKVLEQAKIKDYSLIKEFKGRQLEGLTYAHPFGTRTGKVVLADYVSHEEGTGLVHTAPGHGNEDYITGLKYKLEIIMPVDNKGIFDATAGEFKGLNVYAANPLIMEKLQSLGVLLFAADIEHSYPHCWRCKNPVIFRATKQWFLNIDHDGLRQRLLSAIENQVEWIPAVGKERISAMVELRPDWCLSRQRYWGVPIPALICNHCHEEFLDAGVVEKFAQFVAREGTDSWFKYEVQALIPEGLECPACKAKDFSKGTDILDVWFDSGVSHQAVLKRRLELRGVPAELYLEGSDQHRGWFQSSLIPSVCIDGKPPFLSVLTDGFVVDGEGRKMSKSTGNVISPQEIIKDYGADILRLWVASSDYNEDIRISKEILSRLSEAYRKIRNTAKFILSNLYDFNPDTDRLDYQNLRKIDQWILWRMQEVIAQVSDAYGAETGQKFCFHKAYKGVYDFCNLDLSMYYLDMVKGRLYTASSKSPERRAAQSVIYEVLEVLIKLLAPLLVFTSEEIWQNLPKGGSEKNILSVHLLDWPKLNPQYKQFPELNPDFESVIQLIPEAAKILEEKRKLGAIGSSFDAKIKLLTKSQERYKFLASQKDSLCEIFKVSQVEVAQDSALTAEITLEADKAEGQKCVRCWNYTIDVGSDKTHALLCQNCVKAISGGSN